MLYVKESLHLHGSHFEKKKGFSEPSMKPVFGYIVVPPSQLHWKSPSPWKHSTSRPPQQLFSDNTMINLLFLLDTLKNTSFVSVILTDGPPWCRTQTVSSKVRLFFYCFHPTNSHNAGPKRGFSVFLSLLVRDCSSSICTLVRQDWLGEFEHWKVGGAASSPWHRSFTSATLCLPVRVFLTF